ncbi:organic cation transporter protein-like [Saccostrea echinata]|uniref:organic cation transporter protein-like n=1 Tax=Saccostrea echinata TaxID=191078 RepID=UPI002A7FBBEC|nr:organic cation transporter protein-like [Saccostrea echinata]
MAYDDVFELIGSFGVYQKRLYVLQTLPVIFTAIQTCLSVFILFVPDHRCSIPHVHNDTYVIRSPHHERLVNQTIPLDLQIHSSISEGIRYSKCEVFKRRLNATQRTEIQAVHNSSLYSHECRRWVFDKREFDSTFVTEDNLVCRKKLHRTHATMTFMAGFTAGSFGIGVLSDGFGRKLALMFSILLHVGSNIPLSFITDFWVFSTLRFFSGVSVGGLISTTYVMNLELVGPRMRMWAGMFFQLFWGLGVLLLAAIAFLIRDWRYLNLATSLPTILFLSYYWLVPESTRWLIVRGRHKEAEKIFQHAAKVNKRKCPDRIFKGNENETTNRRRVSLGKLCSARLLVVRFLVICLNWLVVSMEFSGLSLNVSNLGGDVYLNFFMTSVAEILGFLLCIPLLNRVGRKPVYVLSLLSGGFALVLTIFPILYGERDQQWVTVGLSLIGKVGSSAAFATVFLYSAEFFPTVIRNSAIGVTNFCARFGGMLAPYVVDLGQIMEGNVARVLPMTVFGVSAVIVGLMSIILPETLNRKLPETIEDTIAFDRSNKIVYSVELDTVTSQPLNEPVRADDLQT